MLEKRRTEHVGTGLCGRHRDGDRAVGPHLREVVGAVGTAESGVHVALVARVNLVNETGDRVLARRGDGFTRRQFDRFVLAR
jgi:hypothetical protein